MLSKTLPLQLSLTHKYILSILTFLIIPLSGFAIDIYVPSLPAVSHYFAVSKSQAQFTITSYMLGLGIMQFFAGAISDSFGRKKPFLYGILIFFLATVLIPFVSSIQELIFLRFIQGLTVALIVVPMRSVIADLFQGKEYHKMVNYMTIAWSIGPIIAPFIGGYLELYFGWHASFYFLAIYSLFAFIVMKLFLPETSVYQHPFHLTHILVRYREMILNKIYVNKILINAMLYSSIILFSIAGPFLIQKVLHYTPVQFGHIALLTGLAWFVGTLTNRALINVDSQTKLKICLWTSFSIAVIGLLLNFLIPLNIYLLVLPLIGMLWIGGIVFPSNFSQAMALFPKANGSANALFGGFLFLLTGFISGFGTLLKADNGFPLFFAFVCLMSLSLILFYLVQKKN